MRLDSRKQKRGLEWEAEAGTVQLGRIYADNIQLRQLAQSADKRRENPGIP